MFRQSVHNRRCLVPADGFYEWLRLDAARSNSLSTFTLKKTGLRHGEYSREGGGIPKAVMLRIRDQMPGILDEEEAKR